ncbi:penicillin-binding protein [Novosphingobium marinum]|uniref:Penicillin-binding protein 1A n=1 Tax=Novosphingobium marinum TaxID=1514948 RepID=A0A7Z0BSM8_9SPHN|nr:PBP1A family penicillin-binding protein [Novosphingobium marinum]NYH95106.1 penicillin-binding protein 1A [Novosphingobium marinum]GGC24337.1 penicillin-binding protein [Novosphingobium marinum]
MAADANRRRRRKGSSPEPEEKKPFWRRALRSLFIWGTAFALLALIFVGTAVYMTASSLPTYSALKSSQNGQMIVVRARDGTELVSLGPSYGKWLEYEQIPETMKTAMVSVEDRRFRSHIGVDPIGVVRSVWVRVQSGSWRQGGSTITQQLARNIFLNNNRTFGRKVKEAVLAVALETKFSKDEILELYLNKVYFGGGAYGIDAASRKFFGHPATDLSLAESAIIAGLVKAPSRYSPTADVAAAVSRGKVVMQVMEANGAISSARAAEIDLDTVRIAKEEGQNSVRYFTDWALPQLDLLLPYDTDEPIEVWTTLDVGMQRTATTAVQSNAPKGAEGALVSMDRDGAVLAMVGGTDYVTSNYNRAVQSVRQPGSAWKLFVYLAALEAGYTPQDMVVDEPVTIDGWSPRNSGGRFAGEIDVRSAFAYSKNTVAAQLGNEVGFGTVASMARRFGITTPISTLPAMVLGASEVRLIDMTRAFASVAANGTSVEPYGIVKVTGTDGDVIYERESRRAEVLVPQYVAAGITDLLQSAVATGTGRAADIGRPVAGKTGTTSSNKDGWFLGFSSGITTGVWMGRDDARAVPGLQGGRAPARAFAAFMRYAVKDRPVEQFDTELKLPDWQLEPDDEFLFGDPDDYYFVDEQGNLIEPGGQYEPLPPGAAPPPDRNRPDYADDPGPGGPPPAASDDFLDRATGARDPGLRAAPPAPGSRQTDPRSASGVSVTRGAGQPEATRPPAEAPRRPIGNAPQAIEPATRPGSP